MPVFGLSYSYFKYFHLFSQELCIVVCLKDLTSIVDIKTSSRPAMIGSLTDGSTETFWESGDEDKNKTKNITINCVKGINARYVCVHVDNSRDLGVRGKSKEINCLSLKVHNQSCIYLSVKNHGFLCPVRFVVLIQKLAFQTKVSNSCGFESSTWYYQTNPTKCAILLSWVGEFCSYFACFLQNKVTSMTFLTGKAVEDLCRIKQVNILTVGADKLPSFFGCI